ncbi:MAG: DUF805 domain-containing protein, partial [Pseudomonadota bacterium]
MTPVAAIRTCLAKCATFSGRASRSEFWWFCGFVSVVCTAAAAIDTAAFGRPPLVSIAIFGFGPGAAAEGFAPAYHPAGLAMLLPFLAVG